MNEQIPFDFEKKLNPEKEPEKRPYPSGEEILAETIARIKKSGAKKTLELPPEMTDPERSKYRNER